MEQSYTGTVTPSKAIVLMSGGLDSTVCASKACLENDEVLLLMFNYRQRMLSKEMEAVSKIAHFLKQNNLKHTILHEIVPIPFLANLGGSYLTDHEKPVTEGAEALESATAWVPGRNLVMMAIAAAYADARKYDNIYIGINKEEGETYPDNTIDFAKKFWHVTHYGIQQPVDIKVPLSSLNKKEIVKLGMEIKSPMIYSWSCYQTQELHCGKCASCQIKKAAFEANGLDINGYWENELSYGVNRF